MIVRESTYNEALRRIRSLNGEIQALTLAYVALQRKWNNHVELINKKGGQDFIDNAVLGGTGPLTKDDIKSLLQLCHPDKHDGKESAVQMTQKLLKIRDQL